MGRHVEEFFKAYEQANSRSDASTIGDLYATTFMFGGVNGVQAVKREDFLRVIPKMKANFSSMGLLKSEIRNVEVHAINSKYLLANVEWGNKDSEFIGRQICRRIRDLRSDARRK